MGDRRNTHDSEVEDDESPRDVPVPSSIDVSAGSTGSVVPNISLSAFYLSLD
jgi:hypothetical protein